MAAIIPAVAIGSAVGAELPKFFDDAFDQFGAGEGIYLRDGEPAGVVAKIGQAVGRAYCRQYDSVADQYEPGKGERIEKACRPYLDSIGSNGGPGLKQDFRGGQCRKRYLVSYSGQTASSCAGDLFPFSGQAELWGPIGGVSVGPSFCPAGAPRSLGSVRFTAFSVIGGPDLGSQVTEDTALSAESVSITSITVIDGSADDCGNPPPTPVVPPPTPNPQPPPFRFNPSPDIDIDINVNINPDGTFNFNIGTGPITVDPFPDSGGDGGPGGGGGGGGGSAGGDGLPGDPTATNPPAFLGEPGTGGEDVSFGAPPEGKVWVGCLARFIPSRVGIIPGSGSGNAAYTQVVGNISLRYGAERGTAKQVRSEWVESFRPVTALGVTGAFVNSLPQTVVTIFPVAATICPEDVCGESDG